MVYKPGSNIGNRTFLNAFNKRLKMKNIYQSSHPTFKHIVVDLRGMSKPMPMQVQRMIVMIKPRAATCGDVPAN
jgi:hypothetical protein